MIAKWQPRIVMYSYWTKLLIKTILYFYEVLDQFTTHGTLQNDPTWLVKRSRSQQEDFKLLVLTLGHVFWPKELNNIYQSFVRGEVPPNSIFVASRGNFFKIPYFLYNIVKLVFTNMLSRFVIELIRFFHHALRRLSFN